MQARRLPLPFTSCIHGWVQTAACIGYIHRVHRITLSRYVYFLGGRGPYAYTASHSRYVDGMWQSCRLYKYCIWFVIFCTILGLVVICIMGSEQWLQHDLLLHHRWEKQVSLFSLLMNIVGACTVKLKLLAFWIISPLQTLCVIYLKVSQELWLWRVGLGEGWLASQAAYKAPKVSAANAECAAFAYPIPFHFMNIPLQGIETTVSCKPTVLCCPAAC